MRNPLLSIANEMRPQATTYAGGAFNRLNMDWLMGRLSADMAMRFDIQTLRNRARDLVINNASAAAVPAIFSENVVGKDGICLQAKIESTRGAQNDTLNDQIEDAWQRWGEVGTCTVDGRGSWVDVQRMIVEGEVVEGEVLIRMVRGFDNEFGFALDLLDPDQLDATYTVAAMPGSNRISMGIELNDWHRPVFYHLWTEHPSDPQQRIREKVPADQIIHLYVQRRPRQSRAVTWFAPVVVDLKMLGGYREAELVAARTASAKMGFLTSSADSGPPPEVNPNAGTNAVSWGANPGEIEQLPTGYQFTPWDPQHPTSAFDQFDKAILRSIAGALRVSYMSLSGDLTGTSYGSGRIGMLAERAVYEGLQQRLIRQVMTPIYRNWLAMASLSGALRLPSMDVTKYYAAEWHPRVFPWIDPLKDIQGDQLEVAMGIKSLTALAAERGRDLEEVLNERSAEIKLAESLDVPLIISTGTKPKGETVDEGAPDTTEPADAADSAPTKNGKDKPGEKPAARIRLAAGGLR